MSTTSQEHVIKHVYQFKPKLNIPAIKVRIQAVNRQMFVDYQHANHWIQVLANLKLLTTCCLIRDLTHQILKAIVEIYDPYQKKHQNHDRNQDDQLFQTRIHELFDQIDQQLPKQMQPIINPDGTLPGSQLPYLYYVSDAVLQFVKDYEHKHSIDEFDQLTLPDLKSLIQNGADDANGESLAQGIHSLIALKYLQNHLYRRLWHQLIKNRVDTVDIEFQQLFQQEFLPQLNL